MTTDQDKINQLVKEGRIRASAQFEKIATTATSKDDLDDQVFVGQVCSVHYIATQAMNVSYFKGEGEGEKFLEKIVASISDEFQLLLEMSKVGKVKGAKIAHEGASNEH